MLLVSIDEFHFKNYNWLWPYVPTWGLIGLTLSVRDANGDISFERSFTGKGRSHCLSGNCAFTGATKDAMTRLLDQIVEACSTPDFRDALSEAPDVELTPP